MSNQLPSPDAEIEQRLQQAISHHVIGQLAQAESLYLSILAARPEHFDSLHMLGVIASQVGNYHQAIRLFDLAAELVSTSEQLWNNRGNALKEMNQLEAALASYDKAIALNPGFAEPYTNRGNVLHKLGQHESAVASHDKAIAIKPDFALAFYNRGVSLYELGLLDAAIESFDRAIALRPDYVAAYSNRGASLIRLKRFDDAVVSLNRAIEIKPDWAPEYVNRGTAHNELGEYEVALANFDKAIALGFHGAEAFYHRSIALHQLGRLEEALVSCNQAIALNPEYVDALYYRGTILQKLNQIDAALASYDQAIAFRQDCAETHFNKSLALLLSGELERGWNLYEWRWKLESMPMRIFQQPIWLGRETLQGKTILLWHEQGFGDTIQFCRYAELVAELGAQVILEAPGQLVSLLSSLNVQVIMQGEAMPAFDYHCPLLSLPLAFRTHLESIPSFPSYLKADDQKRRKWESKLPPGSAKRIGLVWSGNSAFKNDRNRSIPLSDLVTYLPNGHQYVCLQKEQREIDREALHASDIVFYGEEIEDFSDTAALCELMDVVISVDTSVAHLAGALGTRTLIMLPYSPDWRWLMGREDSPWYPSVSLCRQNTLNDWTNVLEQVRRELIDLKGRSIPKSSRSTKPAGRDSTRRSCRSIPAA